MKDRLTIAACLPVDRARAMLIARVWLPAQQGPSPALVRDDTLYDLSSIAATVGGSPPPFCSIRTAPSQ